MCLKQTFYEASGACDTELFHAQTIWPPGNVEADPLGQPTYEPECVAGQQGGILDIDGSGALTGNTDSKTGELITHPVLSTAAMCYIDGLGQAEMYFEVYSANDKCEGEPMLKGSSDGAHGTLPFGSDTCMSGPSAVPFVPLNQVRYGDRPPSPPGTARGAARADDATWPDEHELNGAGAAEHPEWTMYDNATDSVAETTSVVSDAASHAPGTE